MNDTSLMHNGAGLLVLGMHRSGTSVVSRTLQLCGVDIGARVLGASAGNETGHWEDAVAVETHEALLRAFGTAWDEPFALPADWRSSAAAADAAARIASYMAQRRAHSPWAAKDPRMCLFGCLWREAARAAGMPLSVLLVLRHPAEIAQSLYVRDGLGLATAQLLWLDTMASAVALARELPHAVVGYREFLGDWRPAVARVRVLPGMASVDASPDAADQIVAFVDPAKRHHAAADDVSLIPAVREAWRALSGSLATGHVDQAAAEAVQVAADGLRSQLRPFLEESRARMRALWLRAGRAEARLAGIESGERDPLAQFDLLGRSLSGNHADMVRMLSAASEQVAASAQRADERLEQVAGQISGVGEKLVSIYSNDILRMQSELADMHGTFAAQAAAERERAEHDRESIREQVRRTGEQMQRAEQEHLRTSGLLEDVRALLAGQKDAKTQELEAEIHRLHRDAFGASSELVRLRAEAELLAEIRGSHSWRLTSPLRAMRRLLSGQWRAEDSRRLRQMLGLAPKSALIAGQDAPALPVGDGADGRQPLAAHAGQADVFVWAVIDWHFRTQRPQHLARALASRWHRVFYMSNNFVDAAEPGFAVEPLDDSGRLFQVHLHLPGAPAIYHAMPDDAQARFLQQSLAAVLAWAESRVCISLVQHPYWRELADAVPNAKLVYDCMDHHAGFANNASSILDAERRLVAESDLLVVTSGWLKQELESHARSLALIRNAAEYAHFAQRPAKVFRDPDGRKVIGYFGAIAEWFDVDLVREVARAFPDALVVLVGRDTAGVGEALQDCANVRMQAEVPYAELPYWVHGFDVCLLPFRVCELTLATNPVKAYEYLAAGKALVSVELPELVQFEGVAEVAATPPEFVAAVGRALASAGNGDAAQARRAFAAAQTWEHRARELDAALAALPSPRVSVIVLTYNNLPFTQACLASIERYSDYDNLEVIVVDNASSDGSVEWLRDWADEVSSAGHQRRLLLNADNLGFAAGNNIGLATASGEFLVILNNDTFVTPGWVRTLCAHFRGAPALGLVGPVTNNIGNEARIEIHYADMEEMVARAGRHTRQHAGQSFAIPNVAFFCVAMPRSTYERVGGLDERYGMGFFEDDDYCRRVEAEGLQIRCAEDVFVHHHLSASFDAIGSEAKQALFEKNKTLYEAKWGEWRPHAYRAAAGTDASAS